MGKAYANRKKEELRHKNDFYPTPKCLTWELLKTGWFVFDMKYEGDPTIKILDMQKYILNKNDN